MLTLMNGICVAAAPVTGKFVDSHGFSIKLTEDINSNEIALTIGDVTSNVEDWKNDKLLNCLLFIYMDILIPVDFTIGGKFECGGSTVLVKNFHDKINLNGVNVSDVYVLEVRTSKFVDYGGQKFERRGNRRPIETLYYSIERGLVGFTMADRVFLRKPVAMSTDDD